jgi:hypothetical protein
VQLRTVGELGAIVLLFGKPYGVGRGPLVTDHVDNMLAKLSGSADGLRYALMFMTCILLLSSRFEMRAARNVARNMED